MRWLTYSSVLVLLTVFSKCEMKMSFLYSLRPAHGQFIVHLLYLYNLKKKIVKPWLHFNCLHSVTATVVLPCTVTTVQCLVC